jgi:hypothetical protein
MVTQCSAVRRGQRTKLIRLTPNCCAAVRIGSAPASMTVHPAAASVLWRTWRVQSVNSSHAVWVKTELSTAKLCNHHLHRRRKRIIQTQLERNKVYVKLWDLKRRQFITRPSRVLSASPFDMRQLGTAWYRAHSALHHSSGLCGACRVDLVNSRQVQIW